MSTASIKIDISLIYKDAIDDAIRFKIYFSILILFHGEQAGLLPPIQINPFDRMLVAQAQAEGLEILTADEQIPKYGVKVINAIE